MPDKVCVVIAAKDSDETIAGAIASALHQAEVSSVVVVDDGSTDRTAEVAQRISTDDGRVRVIKLAHNMGPSHARNIAIAESDEPLISILDADDSFLPGRFTQLLSYSGWDMIADDIAFVSSAEMAVPTGRSESSFTLNAAQFIAGNITRSGIHRGEFGFLKPVVSRAFLEGHGLRYDESLRLGEDYELYARMLLAGARFTVVDSCGYRALVRSNSLSDRHRTEDLERLLLVDQALLARTDISQATRQALQSHMLQMSGKFRHRRFLDRRRSHGLLSAALQLGSNTGAWWSVVSAILRDKQASPRVRSEAHAQEQTISYLLENRQVK